MHTMWCRRDVGAYFAVHDGNPFCRQDSRDYQITGYTLDK